MVTVSDVSDAKSTVSETREDKHYTFVAHAVYARLCVSA